MANDRNAGRKRKFNSSDVAKMLELIKGGMRISDVAKKYGTSRQVIGRYINKRDKNSHIVRMYYMDGNKISTVIDADFKNKIVNIQNRTNDNLARAFGVIEKPTFAQFEEFLESRCVPRTRANIKYLLKDMGIDSYDPMQIIGVTNGKLHGDPYYIKMG